MERASSIEALEPEEVLTVLQRLPVKAVLLFGMTCHKLHNLTNSEALWASICAREWGRRAVEALHHHHNDIAAADVGGRWKRLFQQMNSLSRGHWQRIHQGDILPVARASHSMSSMGNKVVVFGGGHQGGRHLDDTWIGLLSEASSMEWQQLSAEHHPSGRFGHSSVLVEDKQLILYGGMNDKGIKQPDIWEFRTHQSHWKLLEVMQGDSPLPPPRGAHAGSYVGAGKLVVFGGIALDGERLGDTWLLNMSAAPTWHQIVTLESPAPRSGHTLTWIGGQTLVLFGGRGSNQQLLDDLWMLDLEGRQPRWIHLKQPGCKLPAPRSGHSATLIANGKVLVFGGENAKRTRKCGIWLLDIAAAEKEEDEFSCSRSRKLWTKLRPQGDVPSKRSFHGACSALGGRAVLIFGGMVDGEVVPRAATGLKFDSELYLLQLLP